MEFEFQAILYKKYRFALIVLVLGKGYKIENTIIVDPILRF